VGHVEIEQNEVRPHLDVELCGLARIGGAFDSGIAVPLEQPLEQVHIGRLVVDDEDAGVPERPGGRHQPQVRAT
jgi:hypothetical protein